MLAVLARPPTTHQNLTYSFYRVVEKKAHKILRIGHRQCISPTVLRKLRNSALIILPPHHIHKKRFKVNYIFPGNVLYSLPTTHKWGASHRTVRWQKKRKEKKGKTPVATNMGYTCVHTRHTSRYNDMLMCRGHARGPSCTINRKNQANVIRQTQLQHDDLDKSGMT